MAIRREDFEDKGGQQEEITKHSGTIKDISLELHQRIRLAASQNDMSISEYVGKPLDEAIPVPAKMSQERHPATRKMLDELMQVRDQILQDRNGQPFEDSVELIRQMREERTQYLMELFTGDKTDTETNNQ